MLLVRATTFARRDQANAGKPSGTVWYPRKVYDSGWEPTRTHRSKARKSGSQRTRRWRKPGSNFWSLNQSSSAGVNAGRHAGIFVMFVFDAHLA